MSQDLDMKKVNFIVEGMKCGGCTSKIEKTFSTLEGINEVNISLESKIVSVQFEKPLTSMALKKEIEALGFSVSKIEKV